MEVTGGTSATQYVVGEFEVTSASSFSLAGLGANTVTVTVEAPALTVIPGAVVTIKNSAETVTLAYLVTNGAGQAIFNLDNGSYKILVTSSLAAFSTATLTVSGTTAQTVTGISISSGLTPGIGECSVYLSSSVAAVSGGVKFQALPGQVINGLALDITPITATVLGNLYSANLQRLGQYRLVSQRFVFDGAGNFTVPDSATVALETLILGIREI
jgi:hypothetical protein